MRKVKGHATIEDVRNGTSTAEDKIGNDRSDKNADAGVEMVAGEGLVTLGRWAANRQEQYGKLIARIHKMIAAVTKAEKEERAKAKNIEKHVLGFDPEKWTDSNISLNKNLENRRSYHRLNLSPPLKEYTSTSPARTCIRKYTTS